MSHDLWGLQFAKECGLEPWVAAGVNAKWHGWEGWREPRQGLFCQNRLLSWPPPHPVHMFPLASLSIKTQFSTLRTGAGGGRISGVTQ